MEFNDKLSLFIDLFNFFNGFRDLQGYDFLYDVNTDKGKVNIVYVKDKQMIHLPMELKKLEFAFNDWKSEHYD